MHSRLCLKKTAGCGGSMNILVPSPTSRGGFVSAPNFNTFFGPSPNTDIYGFLDVWFYGFTDLWVCILEDPILRTRLAPPHIGGPSAPMARLYGPQ